MDADERGARRYWFGRNRAWTADAETRFVRLVLRDFPGSVELDKAGQPIPPEQLTFEG